MNKLITLSVFACVLTLVFTSCSKCDDPIIEVPGYDAKVKVKDNETVYLPLVSSTDNSEGSIKREGSVYKLRNFRQGTMNAIGTAVVTADANYYFDFKENDGTDNTGALVLPNSTRAADLKVNTTAGYKLYYINLPFEDVKATDEFTEATDGKLGLQSSYAPNVIGWLDYSGAPNHLVTPAVNRTLILFKDGKAYFKFRVNSVYSNGVMEKEVSPTNYFYYSIDYQEFK